VVCVCGVYACGVCVCVCASCAFVGLDNKLYKMRDA